VFSGVSPWTGGRGTLRSGTTTDRPSTPRQTTLRSSVVMLGMFEQPQCHGGGERGFLTLAWFDIADGNDSARRVHEAI
jgi:hypothetical protein